MKVAVVTGGAGGIGSAITKALCKENYKTIVIYNKNQESAENLKKEINCEIMKCDVSDENDVRQVFAEIFEKHSRVDLLVNNAAMTIKLAKFNQKSVQDFMDHIKTDYIGSVNCCKQVLTKMPENRSGCIINILSQAVISTPPNGLSDYVCSKYALLGLTKCLAIEYASKNIRVNAISPGMVETKFLKDIPPKAIEITKSITPLGKLSTPDDVANAVVFLASENAANITGINLQICGGAVM